MLHPANPAWCSQFGILKRKSENRKLLATLFTFPDLAIEVEMLAKLDAIEDAFCLVFYMLRITASPFSLLASLLGKYYKMLLQSQIALCAFDLCEQVYSFGRGRRGRNYVFGSQGNKFI